MDIEPLSGSDPKAAALSRGVKGNAVVLAQVSPVLIYERTWIVCSRALFSDEGAIVSLADETNFLAFLHLLCGKAEPLGFPPYV
jgi:hypothetical protein